MRALLLDLDDTLLDFHEAERRSVAGTMQSFGIPPTAEHIAVYSALNRRLWEGMEAGKITKEQLLSSRFALFLERVGYNADDIAMEKDYERRLANSFYLVQGAYEALTELKKSYALYAVSNGTVKVQEKRVKESGLAPFFKDVFFSESVGYAKPDSRFFDAVFAKIPFTPSECLLVGDSLSADIAGASAYGLRSVWLNRFGRERKGEIKVDMELRDIRNLPGLLKYL